MAETLVTSASDLAVRLQSVSLQTESTRKSMFVMMMAGKQPKQAAALAKREKVQSTPDMPIVTITDLQAAAGDKVTCDMWHLVSGKPFMGDKKMQGKGKPLSLTSMEVKINQMRFPIDAGSRMTNKRTKHNLRRIARSEMSNWFARTNDQVIMVHLAGARGTENTEDWNVPLETDEDFADIMINPVQAPTYNRRYIAGGGHSIADIDSTDALTLDDLDVISADLRSQPFPPAPIKTTNDPNGDQQPIWCLIVTEWQWHYMLAASGANSNTWRKFLADATLRQRISNHPLFQGDTGLWNGILVKRMQRAITWNAGEMVREANEAGVESNVAVPAAISKVHRAILLGGQALALARGDAGGGGNMGAHPMRWSEVLDDHGNSLEIGAGQMDGKAKFRFKGTDGKMTDFGVAVIDSYAPDPRSDDGEMLRSAL